MTRRVAIYQPQYFPRLHYVNRALDADVFVLLSSAKYTKSLVHHLPDGGRERRKSYQSDCPIKQPQGEHLLTVPVRGARGDASIDEVTPDDEHGWRHRHRGTLQAAYGRAPCVEPRLEEIGVLLGRKTASLAELNTWTLCWALDVLLDLQVGVEQLDLTTVNERLAQQDHVRLRRVVVDTDLDVTRPDGRQQGGPWTASICAALGADEYVHGSTAAAGYMEHDVYEAVGVRPVAQRWHGRPYPQQHEQRTGFIPNLSVIDLLCNVSPPDALDILRPAGASAHLDASASIP